MGGFYNPKTEVGLTVAVKKEWNGLIKEGCRQKATKTKAQFVRDAIFEKLVRMGLIQTPRALDRGRHTGITEAARRLDVSRVSLWRALTGRWHLPKLVRRYNQLRKGKA